MSLEAVIDNDVLIKCSCYVLLEELARGLAGDSSLGVLGAARYVVPDTLHRHQGVKNPERALAHWLTFLATVEELEPSSDEIELATLIEEHASGQGLPLDGGESQLCAITILRSIPHLVTGDKRAIESLEQIQTMIDRLGELAGRIACLEQVIAAIAEKLSRPATRDLVCAEPGVDKAIAICLQCSQDRVGEDFDPEGLESYVSDLRKRAPSMLLVGPLFS